MSNGIVPDKQAEAINFFTSRLSLWAANAANIGLLPANVSAITAAVSDAQAKLNAALTARANAKSATVALTDSLSTMRSLGGDLIKTIRAYAETTENPAVYSLSNIPPVSPPTPLGPPAEPTNVQAALNSGGAVELAWDGSRLGGTSFSIERQLTPIAAVPGTWTLIAVVEDRTYTDANVPQGQAMVAYRITAQRAGGTSDPSMPGVVLFGTAASQGQSATGLTLAA
jgi:hypothetical protein